MFKTAEHALLDLPGEYIRKSPKIFRPIKDSVIHFIGIGGIGLSGLAIIFHELGYKVQGSDIIKSDNTDRLEDLGMKVYIGHSKDNVQKAEYIVISNLIKEENPELLEAKNKNLEIFEKYELLQFLIEDKFSIAITGANGKTTTTGIMESILSLLNKNLTFFGGGILKDKNKSSYVDKRHKNEESELFLLEADESDDTHFHIDPDILIINNVAPEHLEFYKKFTNIKNNFIELIKRRIDSNKLTIIGINDAHLYQIYKSFHSPFLISFGIEFDDISKNFQENSPKILAKNIRFEDGRAKFDVYVDESNYLGNFEIGLLGNHNILNCLASIAASFCMKLNIETIKSGVRSFLGTKRRFEVVNKNKSIKVIDDYAHNPLKIKALNEAIAQYSKNAYLVLEIHKYSRLYSLFEDYVSILSDVKNLYLVPIDSVGQDVIDGADMNRLIKALKNKRKFNNLPAVDLISDLKDIEKKILPKLRPQDCLVFAGAGKFITKLANEAGKLVDTHYDS